VSVFKHLFHPPPEMPKRRYLWSAVTTVALISVGVSVTVTFILELFTAQPNYAMGFLIAVGVPLIVVPPLAYWHHNVLFELEKTKRQVEELSRTDPLTGLLNRRYFFEKAADHLALSQRHGHPISLLLIDLDHFKQINDRFGHQAGDSVLQSTAAVLRNTTRNVDIPARYGGEEFVLLMPHTDGDAALTFCRRLQRALADEPAGGVGGIPPVTASIGIACSKPHGYEIDRLLAKADDALYRAKAMGRNTHQFSGPTLSENA